MRVIEALLRMGLTGSTVVVLWWVLARVSRDRFSPRWHYGVLKLALCAMLLPAAELAGWLAEALSLTVSAPAVVLPPAEGTGPVLTELTGALPAPAAPAPAVLPAWAGAVLAALWAAGTLGLLLQRGRAYLRFRRQVLRLAEPVEDSATLELFRSCARRTGAARPVELRRAPVPTPLVTGLLRPVLLLPRQGLETGELRYIFLHELTHIRHRDLWVRRASLLALALHWWNPCAHLLNRALREAGEERCDQAVAAPLTGKERYEYGKTLLNTVGSVSAGLGEWTAPLSERRCLERRLLRMLHTGKSGKGMRALAVTAAAVVLICGTVAAASADWWMPQLGPDQAAEQEKTEGPAAPAGGDTPVRQAPALPDEEQGGAEAPAGEGTEAPQEPEEPAGPKPQSGPEPQPEPDTATTSGDSPAAAQPEEPVQEPQGEPQADPPQETQEDPYTREAYNATAEDILKEYEAAKANGTEFDTEPEGDLWEQNPLLAATMRAVRIAGGAEGESYQDTQEESEAIKEQIESTLPDTYPVNSHGETYGSIVGKTEEEYPDLVACRATNGQRGYCRVEEFISAGPGEIPVYDSEGEEVLGTFLSSDGHGS